MCNFLSFKIEKTPDGLQIRTSKSLSDHSDIPGDGYEGEWRDDGTLEIRVPNEVSDNIKSELMAFVKKTYRTRKNMADKLISQYLNDGVLPDYFYQHSKLDDRKLRLFACDCAEHVLNFFEKKYPNDTRPRDAVEMARKFAYGKATKKELIAAGDAAWAAAGAAAGDAAGDAAWASAGAAARDAAWASAGAVAWAAARDAAGDAAGDAARAAENKWQIVRLLQILNEKG